MDKPIIVGDLVVVVRRGICCDVVADMGRIFRVLKVEITHSDCVSCGRRLPCEGFAYKDVAGRGFGYRMARLKRIPPLDELESEKQKEDIREPA